MSKLKYYDGTDWKVVNGQVTGDTLPIGSIMPYGSATAPTNWLVCDGSAVSRTTYAELFAVIGTSFGAGDGSTTFNLPNLKGKVAVGQDTNDTDFDTIGETGGEKEHTLTIQEMPVHNHGLAITGGTETGARFDYEYASGKRYYSGQDIIQNAGNGASHNNLQPYQVVCYIIKAKQSAGVVANVSNTYSTSQTDTYSCNYINSLGKTITFNNEWRLATKPAGSSNLMISIPVLNPNKTTPTFSTGFTAEVYVNGWVSCTYSLGYTGETDIGIRVAYPSGTQITDGLNYLVRFKGTITIND